MVKILANGIRIPTHRQTIYYLTRMSAWLRHPSGLGGKSQTVVIRVQLERGPATKNRNFLVLSS